MKNMDFEAVNSCYENQKEKLEQQSSSNMDQDEYQQIYEDCVKDIKNQEITDA
jgi:hypothetical protein